MSITKPAPVLKYPGSKWRLADWIVSYLPTHETYLEPFFGSGAIFFNKEPSRLETINDLDSDVSNVFRCIREYRDQLIEAMMFTPYSREEHLDCWTLHRTGEPVEDARRFLVRIWMNHGMRLRHKGGWAHVTRRRGGAEGGFASRHIGWNSLPDRIALAAIRLKGAQLECRPALDVISRHAHPDCLIYADPPYIHSTRSSVVGQGHRQYTEEMTDEDHAELLFTLNHHPGPVLLSGYDHPMYEELETISDWLRVSRKAYAEKGQAREECLWINPVAQERLEGRLF